LVELVDTMLAKLEGDRDVNAEDLFEGFMPEEHEAEAERRWGATDAWKESKRRTGSYGPEQWRAIKAEHDAIVAEMAGLAAAGAAPDSAGALALAERHRRHIDRWYYACSPAMHAGVATLYTTDPRFAEVFDRHAEGLSSWVEAAIRANAAASGRAGR
jgi:MerR family transcriptional regulator, thiopeptide resistance regulator